MSMPLRVALDLPIAPCFDYFAGPWQVLPGHWVWVPWGQTIRLGLVLAAGEPPQWPSERIREIHRPAQELQAVEVAHLTFWQQVADYYHCSVGELLVAAMPKALRTEKPPAKALAAVHKAWRIWQSTRSEAQGGVQSPVPLRTQQAQVYEALIARTSGFVPSLIHGITGSGKTLVYLSFIRTLIERDPKAQILLLVPEIGLTPQLAQTLEAALPPSSIAVLHSGLTDNLRAAVWLAAGRGELRLVVGTRSAIFVPMPHLAAIIVDEEHDPSYKQWESVRYQARDLAVWRAQSLQIPVILGSATPSMESWYAALRGRYRHLSMSERANLLPQPGIDLVDMRKLGQLEAGLAPRSVALIDSLLREGAQVLIFLNRRGFSPTLQCRACAWVSPCMACSAYQVLHRQAGRFELICHHCGQRAKVPRFCPQCGNSDLSAQGRGTQRLEEELQSLFPKARIARLDRDVAQGKRLTQSLEAIHRGDVDMVVGTQMLAKGHDWARLQAVIVLEADNGLFAADFRATERLFANLMQVAGRAGRSVNAFTQAPAVLIQTAHPDHPLFADVRAHDFCSHAQKLLDERRSLGLPPYRHHVVLRVQAKKQPVVFAFLDAAKAWFDQWILALRPQDSKALRCYDPVPMNLLRVDHWFRAQLLLEAGDRPLLHRCLNAFHVYQAQQPRQQASLQWFVDVDPQEI